jgi:hypothetical protein
MDVALRQGSLPNNLLDRVRTCDLAIVVIGVPERRLDAPAD